jgi:enoyl-CoA hydratase
MAPSRLLLNWPASRKPALRNDRLSVLEQWELGEDDAMRNEIARGRETIASGESHRGAARFSSGAGRHGRFE